MTVEARDEHGVQDKPAAVGDKTDAEQKRERASGVKDPQTPGIVDQTKTKQFIQM